MGGRYGASSDGSSAYQDRRPSADDREPEQQTVAEAVRSVRQRQENTSTRQSTSSSSGGSGDTSDPSESAATTASRSLSAATDRLVRTTIDVDKRIADVVASSVVTQIQTADDRILEDDDEWLV